MKEIILASKSPRRVELLKEIYPGSFLVIPSDIDEESVPFTDLKDKVIQIATKKLERSMIDHPNSVIISSDTMVVHNGFAIGKPKNEKEAFDMLKKLSGDYHYVYTAYAFYNGNGIIEKGLDIAKVYINKMDDLAIKEYIKEYKPFDKAGSYGIQDAGMSVEIIHGTKDVVMGFGKESIKKLLIKYNII